MTEEQIGKLSDIIDNYRRLNQVTQYDFGRAAGMKNPKKIGEWAQLKNLTVTVEEFYGIAHALDVSPGALAVQVGIPYAVVEQGACNKELCSLIDQTFAMLDEYEKKAMKDILVTELQKCQHLKKHTNRKYS